MPELTTFFMDRETICQIFKSKAETQGTVRDGRNPNSSEVCNDKNTLPTGRVSAFSK